MNTAHALDEAPKDYGLFIVIDGLDAVGKTTAARLLSQNLDAFYLRPLSALKKQQLQQMQADGATSADAHAFTLHALRKTCEVVDQHRCAGKTVVIDRYLPSILSYYPAKAAYAGEPFVPQDIDQFQFLRPDACFFLTLFEPERQSRILAKPEATNGDRLSLDDDFRRQVLKGFQHLLALYRMTLIDTTNKSPPHAVGQILRTIRDLEPPTREGRRLPTGLSHYAVDETNSDRLKRRSEPRRTTPSC